MIRRLHNITEKHPILVLLLVSWALLIYRLEDKPMATRGEAREAIVAQSMLEKGEWILGEGYGGIVPSKPPLLHWLIGVVSTPIGEVTDYTARLPSAIVCTLFVIGLFVTLRRNVSSSSAFITSLILLTSFEWLRAASTSRVDMLFACCLAGGLLFAFRWVESKKRELPIGAISLFSAAVLTKGPAGMVIPCGIISLYLLIEKRGLGEILWRNLQIFAPVFILGSSWYLLAFLSSGDAFVDRVYYENIARMAGTQEDTPHRHGVFYLLGALITGFFPWTLVLIPGVMFVKRIPAIRYNHLSPLVRFSLCASLFVIVFFSIPSSKRGVYLLPAYPFIALLVSIAFERVYHHAERTLRYIYLALASSVLLLLLCYLALQFDPVSAYLLRILNLDPDRQRAVFQILRGVDSGGLLSRIISPVVSISLITLAISKVCSRKSTSYVLAWLFLLVGVSSTIVSAIYNGLSPRLFSAVVASQVPSSQELYSYGYEFYGVSFYSDRVIRRWEVSSPKAGYVVLFEKDLSELKSHYSDQFIFEIVERSENSIERFGRFVLLVRFESI